jgi:hypothetical protein
MVKQKPLFNFKNRSSSKRLFFWLGAILDATILVYGRIIYKVYHIYEIYRNCFMGVQEKKAAQMAAMKNEMAEKLI